MTGDPRGRRHPPGAPESSPERAGERSGRKRCLPRHLGTRPERSFPRSTWRARRPGARGVGAALRRRGLAITAERFATSGIKGARLAGEAIYALRQLTLGEGDLVARRDPMKCDRRREREQAEHDGEAAPHFGGRSPGSRPAGGYCGRAGRLLLSLVQLTQAELRRRGFFGSCNRRHTAQVTSIRLGGDIWRLPRLLGERTVADRVLGARAACRPRGAVPGLPPNS